MSRLLALSVLVAAAGCVGPNNRIVDRIELSVPADGLAAAALRQGIGDAFVAGEEGATEVVLVATLLGPDHDQHMDDSVLDDLILDLEACGDRACARADLADPHLRYSLETELFVPASLDVTVEDGLGDLWIRDVASLEVRDGSGDLDVSGVPGPVWIEDDLGDTSIVDVAGGLVVIDGSGDLRIQDIRGGVEVDDDLGDLSVLRVEGDVDIVDGSGDILVEDASGDVLISDDLGDIVVRRIGGSLIIRSDSTGDVRVEDVPNGVVYGDAAD